MKEEGTQGNIYLKAARLTLDQYIKVAEEEYVNALLTKLDLKYVTGRLSGLATASGILGYLEGRRRLE